MRIMPTAATRRDTNRLNKLNEAETRRGESLQRELEMLREGRGEQQAELLPETTRGITRGLNRVFAGQQGSEVARG